MNYSEQMFQAIDTIVKQRLNEVSFDKTEICTIISQDKDDSSKYWVTNESGLKFQAQSSDDREYTTNQRVYVTIPQGDYALEKIIIGSYTTENSNKNLYIKPFDKFVINSSGYLFESLELQANGNEVETEEISFYIGDIFDYTRPSLYDYIGLKFSFETNIDSYTGSFALTIALYDENGKQLNTSNNLIISSKNLYGNPYQLNQSLIFEHLFPWPQEIKDITKVKSIKIKLAQDGNFENSGIINFNPNTNAAIYFGYDIKNVPNNDLILTLKEGDSLTYTPGDYDNTTIRTLYLDWFFTEEGKKTQCYSKTSSSIPPSFETFEVYLLHYVDGSGNTTHGILPDKYAWNWEIVQTVSGMGVDPINPISNYNTSQYKAVIKYKYSNDDTIYYVESNGIIFNSTKLMPPPGATNSASQDTIRLELETGDTGVYNIYGLDGCAMDQSYISKQHIITAKFLDSINIEDTTSVSYVYWTAPTENTMIEEFSYSGSIATFKIKNKYLPGASNNTINCIAYLISGEIRRGSLTLQFGEFSSNGTNYSFNIDFADKTCLYAEEDSSIHVIGTFTKNNGEVMTFPEIEWSWATPIENPIIDISVNQGNSTILKYIGNSDVPTENYYILQATINDYALDNGNVSKLVAYLPIPIANAGWRPNYISGATRVVYGMDNKTVSYSKDPYKVYTEIDGQLQELPVDEWSIASTNDSDGVPDLRKFNGEYSLRPTNYTSLQFPKVSIYCKSGETVIWSQPILILSNAWNSDTINGWNGAVKIDEKEGNIKAPFFIAGKKNDKNKLTGVVIGDLEKSGIAQTTTGIYGFEEGQPRYSLTDQGAFYVGKDDNFISFNEDVDNRSGPGELLIKSQKFNLTSDKIYIGDTPDSAGNIINFNNIFTVTSGGVVAFNGANGNATINLPISYYANNHYILSEEEKSNPNNWNSTIGNWGSSIYLWTRTKVSDNSYNYSYVINQNAQVKTEYSIDNGDTWQNTYPDAAQDIYYRKVRYIYGLVSSPTDTIEGPTLLPKGADGYTPQKGKDYFDGTDGKDGQDGTSITIESTSITYQAGSSGTTKPTGDWETAIPTVPNGQYLWTKTEVKYSDNNSTTSYSVAYKGTNGKDGTNGEDGTSYYTHIRYSNSSDGSNMGPDSSNKTYIGVYTGTSSTAPTTANSYTWSKFKGETGATGATGNGISSITYYYATTETQTAPNPSSIKSTTIPTLDATNKYLWQKEVIDFTDSSVNDKTTVVLLAVYGDTGDIGATGPQGDAGYTINLSKESHTFTGGTFDAANIVTATKTGNNIYVDDVSPFEHELDVKLNGSLEDVVNTTVSITGKNLFDINNPVFSSNSTNDLTNHPVRITSDGIISFGGKNNSHFGTGILIPMPEGQTFTVSCEIVSGTFIYACQSGASVENGLLKDFNYIQGSTSRNGTAITYTQPEGNSYIAFSLLAPSDGDLYSHQIKNLQIEFGDEATEYEEFVGYKTATLGSTAINLIRDFEDNRRLSMSGGGTSELRGYTTTPYIDFGSYPKGTQIHLSGINWSYPTENQSGYGLCVYSEPDGASGSFIESRYLYDGTHDGAKNHKYISTPNDDGTDTVIFMTRDLSKDLDFRYVRFCGEGASANASVKIMVPVGEELNFGELSEEYYSTSNGQIDTSLQNYDTAKNSYIVSDLIDIQPNTQYIVSAENVVKTSSSGTIEIKILEYGNDGSFKRLNPITTSVSQGNRTNIITTTSETYKIRVRVYTEIVPDNKTSVRNNLKILYTDRKIKGLTSISPHFYLVSNRAEAECTYNVDVQKYASGGSVETTITAYKGKEKQNVTITKVNGKNASTSNTDTGVTGLKFKCSTTSISESPIITFTATKELSSDGAIPIEFTVGGVTFTKIFTYSIAFAGITVSSVKPEYAISASNTTAPTTGWQDDLKNVAWDPKKYLWYREKTTYSNNTYAYTIPILDESLSLIGQWCSEADKTYIDGGKIYTGSITADKIDVNNLYSNKAKIGDWTIDKNVLYNHSNIKTDLLGEWTLQDYLLIDTIDTGDYFVTGTLGNKPITKIYVHIEGGYKAFGAYDGETQLSAYAASTDGAYHNWFGGQEYKNLVITATNNNDPSKDQKLFNWLRKNCPRNSTGISANTSDYYPSFWAGYNGTEETPLNDANFKLNTKFYVTSGGHLYAQDAEIKCKITATSGIIGGWSLNTDEYGALMAQNGTIGLNPTSGVYNDMSFWAGGDAWSAPFRVKNDGSMYSTSGKIGNWFIDDTGLKSELANMITDGYVQIYPGYVYTISGKNAYKATWSDIGMKCGTLESDFNLKNDVMYLADNLTDSIYDSLKPVSFKYKEEAMAGDTEAVHFGFIAQDVENTFKEVGINNIGALQINDNGYYSLNKEEFIALNTWQIQKLKTRVAELEKEIKELKQNAIQ